MAGWHTPRTFLLTAGAVGALALAAAGGWLALRGRPGSARPGPAFLECADEAGLTWRMKSLPDEQGRTFKINLYDHGSGVAVGDFDGDGRDDVYFCNQLGPNALYRNNGDGTFTDVARQAGVALGDRVCVAATWADYLNEGRPSLYVTSTRGGNVLFRNNGDGTFTDVTAKAGLAHVGHSQAAVFFDYDNDGLLDLFLTNTAQWTTEDYDKATQHWLGQADFDRLVFSPKEYNVLYHNNGDGTFTDVTAKAGLGGRGWAGDAVAFDYDGDGYPDLFVTCMFGRGQLYRNNRDGTFTDVTLQALGRTPFGGMGAKAFDYNNDGRLDLFVVDMHSDMWVGLDWEHTTYDLAVASQHKKFPYFSGPPALENPAIAEREKGLGRQLGFAHEELLFGNACYRNEGGGRFAEVSDQAGLETFWPWGIATGDFDNDGSEDAFLPSGMGYPFYYWPNALLMNQGDGTFRDRAEELGLEPPPRGKFLPNRIDGRTAARSSRCAVAGDFRGAGRLDLVVNNFNDRPYYYRNGLPPRHWVEFRLRGTRSNRDAVGAVVRLYRAGGAVLTRQVSGACGYLAQPPRTLHFGLGDSPGVVRAEVTWPGGRRQDLGAVAADRLIDVVEAGGDR
jgi:hypothetical protein